MIFVGIAEIFERDFLTPIGRGFVPERPSSLRASRHPFAPARRDPGILSLPREDDGQVVPRRRRARTDPNPDRSPGIGRQLEIYEFGLVGRLHSQPVAAEEFERKAKDTLVPGANDAQAGGAGPKTTDSGAIVAPSGAILASRSAVA